MDFLLHVVPEFAALGGIGTEFALRFRPLDFIAAGIPDRDIGALDERDIAFLEKAEAPCHGQQGSNVRGDEILVDTMANHDRAAFTRKHEGARVVSAHHDERECALEFGDGRPYCSGKLAGFLQML